MKPLRQWSFGRVILTSLIWLLVAVVLTVAWTFFHLRWQVDMSSGSGGIGAVSVGISEAVVWLALLPAIGLIGVWLATRWFGN